MPLLLVPARARLRNVLQPPPCGVARALGNQNWSSGREVRIWVPEFFSVVCFSRGTLPQKRGQRALLGDLETKPKETNRWPLSFGQGSEQIWQSRRRVGDLSHGLPWLCPFGNITPAKRNAVEIGPKCHVVCPPKGMGLLVSTQTYNNQHACTQNL